MASKSSPSHSPFRSRLSMDPLEDRLAPATFTVVNANDGGHGSLRAAIVAANTSAGADAINFNIPGSGVHTINLTSALPTITGQLTIAGNTQPGFGIPVIELNGAGAGAGVSGLSVDASGSIIRGLCINRFAGDGIRIRGSNCVVANCFIGTDPNGALARANGGNGVRLYAGASTNTIGGRSVISGNTQAGILITGAAAGNVVRGSLIGVNSTSMSELPNLGDGVKIAGGAKNNTIGSTDLLHPNTISGNNQIGVEITGTGTSSNHVKGNLIGTNGTGTAAVANWAGVLVTSGATGNVIGGAVSGAGNTISGNNGLIGGVAFTGAGTSGNTLSNNRIGTDATGSAALGNVGDGVFIGLGAASIVVSNNVISGHSGDGLVISGASNNVVTGNRIGTDATGTIDLGNSSDGILILGGATNNVIGGTTFGTRNIISGNNQNGVEINGSSATGNKIQSNFIGTKRNGTTSLGNTLDGVLITAGASKNVVGGTVDQARNVISGNGSDGLQIDGGGTTGNNVRGNYIGTDRTGTTKLGNTRNGVFISSGASNNIIGGPAAGTRNVISGNDIDGVQINGTGTNGNKVQGNYIGTDRTGTAKLGNDLIGVHILAGASSNVIGGTIAETRNVISDSGSQGVKIEGAGSAGNSVRGNYIGTDNTGTEDLGNFSEGVFIGFAATGNVVGGTTAGARNVISGNDAGGVEIFGAGTALNVVQGNFIGTAATGSGNVGNNYVGVQIFGGASNNVIGGTATGAGNLIARNGNSGVVISDAGSTGNSVQANSIFANGGLGIDLGTIDTVQGNDLNDGDSGPNDLLNFPVLTLARLNAGNLRIVGSINTELGKSLRIEFFASPTADPSGFGEGARFLGFVVVDTNAGNTANFNVLLGSAGVLNGQVITATATDDDGNTSEFSLAKTVTTI